MAEAAHLTSAVSHDKPSYFEVLAQESLLSTVRPAVKHAIRVVAESKPERFGWFLLHFDEIYTFLDFLVEHHHLRKYAATFSEHFYSLRRDCNDSTNGKLSTKVLWKSLFLVVLLPYVKQKFDEYFENQRHLYNTFTSNKAMAPLTKAFVAIYPYVHTAWEATVLAYQTGYLLGKLDHHSPFLFLSGATLVNDLETTEVPLGPSRLSWANMSVPRRALYLLGRLGSLCAVGVSTGLSVGVFFVQFLDWWYASETTHTSLTALPIPEAPQDDKGTIDLHWKLCPVCHRTRSNDTALSVSGYVFCYPCIYDYVSEYKKCPVTQYPAQTDHLIKLYRT
ncbi:peroxisome assembly protein 12-like [Dreissena polymorpha]|uniref:Peroxisome assembly protein 12 n=1 Tax=Dreissena polymorpha TaxID=45954 RepID=A0A9D4MWD3_DREPO|nr:peroxisome assembly protein 12-like [Dreissena polymorpha]KAH3883568.1 hypothetical protein DPMN_007528 [Dreissena polymorpha]